MNAAPTFPFINNSVGTNHLWLIPPLLTCLGPPALFSSRIRLLLPPTAPRPQPPTISNSNSNSNKSINMPSSMTLHYFDFTGRAEATRLALAYTGKDFEDQRMDFQEYGASKWAGQGLPVLDVRQERERETGGECQL